MEDNTLGATELNEKAKIEQELDEALQEYYEVKEEIKKIELPEGYKAVSLSKYKNVNLTGKLKNCDGVIEKDVYALELEDEEKKRLTQLYTYKQKELVLIAIINEKNELILEEGKKEELYEKYKGFIEEGELDGIEGEEKTFYIDREEMDKEKEFETSLENEKDKDREEDEKEKGKEEEKTNNDNSYDAKTEKIAKKLGVKPEDVLMVVEVKDEVTLSRVLNKNIDRENLYAVKLRQDSGGVGSNDWTIVNEDSKGEIGIAMKEDPSDTMQDISQTVGLKNNNLQSPDLDPGDINAIQKNGTRYVETNISGTRHNDEYAILETQKDLHTTVHVAKEGEDGQTELLCDDEHEHNIEKIELPDRDIETDEEDRTPGGDAYDRRFEHRH